MPHRTCDGLVEIVTWRQVADAGPGRHLLLDVRTEPEVAAGTIPGAVNIPLDALRGRLGELPADRKIVAFCQIGLRGYLAARILAGHGFTDCANLSDGYKTYSAAAGEM